MFFYEGTSDLPGKQSVYPVQENLRQFYELKKNGWKPQIYKENAFHTVQKTTLNKAR
jgi:hypothetical protein